MRNWKRLLTAGGVAVAGLVVGTAGSAMMAAPAGADTTSCVPLYSVVPSLGQYCVELITPTSLETRIGAEVSQEPIIDVRSSVGAQAFCGSGSLAVDYNIMSLSQPLIVVPTGSVC